MLKSKLARYFLLLASSIAFEVTCGKEINRTEVKRGVVKISKNQVLDYLYEISGSRTVSGQHNREPNSNPTLWTQISKDITGLYPGLWGGDFLFSPHDVENRETMINEAINQWNSGSLVSLTWHVCPPTIGETCGWDSDGILSSLSDAQWGDLINDGGPSSLHGLWKARIDTIVPHLKKLESAGVIVLFRPIHEMNEGWSWWGGRGGSGGSAQLYRITHWYLQEYLGLTNLLWVWNVKDVAMDSISDFWPGDSFVDIVSLDIWVKKYPSDSDYQKMLQIANGKPIALAEVGAIPPPSLLDQQPNWTWWMVWAEYLKDVNFNTDDSVKESYYSGRTLRQGDLSIFG